MVFEDGWPSGQRQQTVNLPRYALRRFESFPVHQPRETIESGGFGEEAVR